MLSVLKYNGMEIAKNLEFARTKLRQMSGLMFRKDVPSDYSMIFVLKKQSPVNVHMLFMRFPVDVIFLDEEKKVMGLYRLNPWTGYKAVKNVKYVLEMEAGAIERYNISIGGQMEFEEGL